MPIKITLTLLLAVILVSAAPASEEPLFAQYWPDAEGLRFEYDFHYDSEWTDNAVDGTAILHFGAETAVPGGTARLLEADHTPVDWGKNGNPGLSGVALAAWQARPDLREAIEAHYANGDRSGYWGPLLIHGGMLQKTADSVSMWQDDFMVPTWLFLEADIGYGATFSFGLLGDVSSDIVLHGMVTDVDAVVETSGGTYTNALKLVYVVDFGTSALTNESGEEVGEIAGSMRGHVYYVRNVGPVESYEEMMPVEWMDCWGGCEDYDIGVVGLVTDSYHLSLRGTPVSNEDRSWSDVKAMFR